MLNLNVHAKYLKGLCLWYGCYITPRFVTFWHVQNEKLFKFKKWKQPYITQFWVGIIAGAITQSNGIP